MQWSSALEGANGGWVAQIGLFVCGSNHISVDLVGLGLIQWVVLVHEGGSSCEIKKYFYLMSY